MPGLQQYRDPPPLKEAWWPLIGVWQRCSNRHGDSNSRAAHAHNCGRSITDAGVNTAYERVHMRLPLCCPSCLQLLLLHAVHRAAARRVTQAHGHSKQSSEFSRLGHVPLSSGRGRDHGPPARCQIITLPPVLPPPSLPACLPAWPGFPPTLPQFQPSTWPCSASSLPQAHRTYSLAAWLKRPRASSPTCTFFFTICGRRGGNREGGHINERSLRIRA